MQFKRLKSVVGPILRSFAFTRFENITFLGILSPRFARLSNYPFRSNRTRNSLDGSRADHSLGVARLVLRMCHTLKFSARTERYGLAWALLHDIGTWPLSHTGEAAFSSVTQVGANRLREMIIRGSNDLPEYLCLRKELRAVRVDGDVVLCLFKKDDSGLSGELQTLWTIINSPLTPDTLEGMHRSGRVFEVSVPEPEQIIDSIVSDMFLETLIDKGKSKQILQFWRAKSRIYKNYINSQRAIEFESAWANKIEHRFQGASLLESLLLPENSIISAADEHLNLPPTEKRYKPPLDYYLTAGYQNKQTLAADFKLSEVARVLAKRRKVGP